MYLLTITVLFLHLLAVSSVIYWVSSPENQAVLNGQDVRLDCIAKDTEGTSLIYLWRFNASVVPEKTSLFTNNSLLIPRFDPNDVGQYECMVTVNGGQDASETASTSKSAVVILAYINNFVVHPKSVQAEMNMTVTFECITGSSAPYPKVRWEVNGQILTEGVQLVAAYGEYDKTGLSTQYSMKLEITAERKHSGIIRCMALNNLLNEDISSSEAAFFIKTEEARPQIITPPPASVTLPVNSSLILNCQVEGHRARTLWFKNGISVDGTTTSYIHRNGSMIFVRVLLEDSGIYFCRGVNIYGTVTSATSNVTITVLGMNFEVEPMDAVVFAGQPVTLNCIPPFSIPPARVTWYKDYQPLVLKPGDTTLSLVSPTEGIWDLHFTSVQASESGDYFCVAENPAAVPTSRTSRVATITVQGAPIFTEPPLSQKIIKGRLLQLTCKVGGSPDPTVHWLFDGQKMEPATKMSLRNNNQELWISKVDKSHEGTYTCVAQNIFGRKSVNVSVHVIVPPVTLKHFGNIVATSGSTAVIPCDVYGDPTPAVRWYKDGEVLEGEKWLYSANLSLRILNVTSLDQGNYSCRAQNKAGSTWANGTLSVLVPPQITKGPIDNVVVKGNAVLLACSNSGKPKPKIQWLFNSTRYLPEGVSLLSDRLTLRISRVGWEHVGTYTCIATNSVGLDSKSGSVKLRVPPSIQTIMGLPVVDKGETINLDCTHKGTPFPSVVWTRNGEIVHETLDGRVTFPTRSSLRIKFSAASDAGTYTCNVTNDVGTDSHSVQVYVIEAPKPPVLSSAIGLSKSSVELVWIPNSQEPFTNVSGYAVSYKQRPEVEYRTFPGRLPPSMHHYEVEGLLPGTQYTFMISAENSAGLGDSSNALSVTTLQAGPSEPVKLRLLSTSAHTARLSWEVPQQPNGQIRKYQVQYREQDSSNNSTLVEYRVQEITSPSLPTQEYELGDLRPYSDYQVRVRAANVQFEKNLWGSFSAFITVSTLIAAPSSPPRNIVAIPLSPHAVRIVWQTPHVLDQNGPLTSYRVKYRQILDNKPYREVTVLSPTVDLIITELSPWENYSLTMEAENSAGWSPESEPVLVQTLPSAPVVAPVNVRAVVQSSTAVTVSWEVPAVREWSSQISGLMLEYRRDTDTDWTRFSVTGVSQTTFNISDLLPWSGYRIRAAFFTDQVSPGRGPYTDTFSVQTLQDLPSPVQNLNFSSTNTSISIMWNPPDKLNGELQHYKITYYYMGLAAVDSSESVVQEPPGILTNQRGPLQSVLTTLPEASLSDLIPNAVYNVSVSAATMIGQGLAVHILAGTKENKPATEVADSEPLLAVTTVSAVPVSQDTLTDPNPESHRNLPVIVAGALTGGICVLVIIIIIIWRCLKKRQAGRDQYMKSIVSGVRIMKRNSGNFDRQSLDPGNIGEEDIVSDVQQRYGSFSSHDPVPQSPTSVDSSTGEVQVVTGGSGAKVKKSNSFFRNLRSSISGDSVFAISSGIENPSYFEENASATLPRSGVPSMTAEELYSQVEKSQRKNRMRSESAAAIAVMRSSGNLAIPSNDTDSLIPNEAVVVYNERTVL